MPLVQDARKPIFDLRVADGALGSTGRLVRPAPASSRISPVHLMVAAGIPLAVAS